MSFTVIIPARFASTRFPEKMLAELHGKPMLQHVYERAKQSDAKAVYVATDDKRIEDAAKQFTDNVVMTSVHHTSGTTRLAEAVDSLELGDDEVIVNVQGDEPGIPPEVINQVANLLINNTDADIATLCCAIDDVTLVNDPNVVKVVLNKKGQALYFSRSPIPHLTSKLFKKGNYLHHIGIYAYHANYLKRFANYPATLLDQQESLEQLRAMVHGDSIVVAKACKTVPPGVDTPGDLDKYQ